MRRRVPRLTVRLHRPRLALESAVALGVLVVLTVVGGWVYANLGLGMMWFYATAVIASFVLLFLAPYAAECGHPREGVVAVWLALFFGPLSLVVVVPWALGLGSRYEAERVS
jgi:hypothetical protein